MCEDEFSSAGCVPFPRGLQSDPKSDTPAVTLDNACDYRANTD